MDKHTLLTCLFFSLHNSLERYTQQVACWDIEKLLASPRFHGQTTVSKLIIWGLAHKCVCICTCMYAQTHTYTSASLYALIHLIIKGTQFKINVEKMDKRQCNTALSSKHCDYLSGQYVEKHQYRAMTDNKTWPKHHLSKSNTLLIQRVQNKFSSIRQMMKSFSSDQSTNILENKLIGIDIYTLRASLVAQ